MIPDRNRNIYPNNEENIRAILNFYFQIPDGNDIDILLNQKKFEVNQIEYIAEQVSAHLNYLQNEVGYGGLTITNVMKYGMDAMTEYESKWQGSRNRKRITKELKELIIQSNDLDFDSL